MFSSDQRQFPLLIVNWVTRGSKSLKRAAKVENRDAFADREPTYFYSFYLFTRNNLLDSKIESNF